MPRSLSCVVAIAALSIAVPALAADYDAYPELRPSYPDDWETGEDNPLRFEAGLRYWYSIGQQDVEDSGQTYSASDRSHILEGHFRIDDLSTSSFVKGNAGYAVVTDGEYSNTLDPDDTDFTGGQIGYAGADFGWMPLGSETAKFGLLTGYQFSRESPGRQNYDVDHVDGLNIHELRLGVTGHADLGGMFDLDAELAAVPYAYASGATAEVPFADTVVQGITVNRRQTEMTGALYGASGQLMLGIHPTENLTLRVGGRASYLTGSNSTTTRQWNAATPDSFLYSSALLDGLSLWRYGALVELTGRF
ncbi:hypothetical protein [uncultured Devosia sp.]|uniref:hypothetical protein n=1 Tax=uncultured Devosia sp. TaxID=211434 RepID=UPI0035CB8BDF